LRADSWGIAAIVPWEVATTFDGRVDPADGLIASTRLVHQVPLVTRHRKLRGSRLVPLA
jgi:predicted nucleic acid-binding protein